MMTREEERAEFWLLTQGILQDSKVDASEARVIKRWLEEHREGNAPALVKGRQTEEYEDNGEHQDLACGTG